jgi:hypothetical protein
MKAGLWFKCSGVQGFKSSKRKLAVGSWQKKVQKFKSSRVQEFKKNQRFKGSKVQA